MLFSPAAFATTWTQTTETDPVAGGKCVGNNVMSYGGYIYNWPSKYDLVFWPMTDRNFIYYCPESGYAAFGGDFKDITPEDKKALAEWLKVNFKKDQKPPTDLQSLDWLEKLYSVRKMDGRFWSMFHRLRAYDYSENGENEKSLARVRMALPLIEKSLAAGPKDFDLLEAYYLMGEYSRRLGEKEKSKKYFDLAKTAEYKDEDGSVKKGHPYIMELIADSEMAMDKPGERPVSQKRSGEKRTKSASCGGAIKSAMANVAIAEEAYYTDHDKYTADIKELQLAANDIASGVTVEITKVTREGYMLKGTQKACDEDMDGKTDVYYWDSLKGGLQE